MNTKQRKINISTSDEHVYYSEKSLKENKLALHTKLQLLPTTVLHTQVIVKLHESIFPNLDKNEFYALRGICTIRILRKSIDF